MKSNICLPLALILTIITSTSAIAQLSETMIRHSVICKLNVPAGSPEEKQFLEAAWKLKAIPNVSKFEVLRQTSKKNKYDFAISMEFKNQKQYQEYLDHPDHAHFVEAFWKKYVADFLEMDFETLHAGK